MTVFLLAVASALVFSFLCSISEAVLLSVSRGKVAQMERTGSRAGRILAGFKQDPDVPIAAILILNTIAHTVGATIAGAAYEDVFTGDSIWIFSVVFTLAVLLLTEIVPKTLGIVHAGRFAGPVALGVQGLIVILRPVLFLTRKLSGLLKGKEDPPITSLEEIAVLAAVGHSQGAVGPRAAQIIQGATRLRDLQVDEVMVPRNAMAVLDGTKSLKDNLRIMERSGFSRFPYAPDGNVDKITGVVLVKDLLFRSHGIGPGGSEVPAGTADLADLAAEVLMVPESTRLTAMLRQFQEARRHLAIVVDECGGTAGLVTLEDVLEEVVGEIEDETDREEAQFSQQPDGSLLCLGRAETHRVFNHLGIQETTDAHTVGGFVAERLGRVPRVGESIQAAGHTFTITRATRRRAERVLVRPERAEPPVEQGEGTTPTNTP